MKVKKFKNLWTMGLIIFGTILISLYLIKLIFPQFVIGIAEYEPIVKFGEYVDTHLWAYYLFGSVTCFIGGYFYLCACCRKKRLTLFDLFILLIEVIFLFVVQKFAPTNYVFINVVCMLLMPIIICKKDKQTDIKYMYSTIITFSVHIIAQVLSLEIRDIGTLVSHPNIATFTILLIDSYIWLIVLYNYFNYKEANYNGNA